MLTWPHPGTDWADLLEEAERTYLKIAKAISQRERVLVVASDTEQAAHIAERLATTGIPKERYGIGIAPSNDTWARDHGPITVEDHGQIMLVDFRFNGWGNKYPHQLDDRITERLHRQGWFGNIALEPHTLILEGGGIETDGRGTLLATRSCLLTSTRNPGLDQTALEQHLRDTLGVERFLWIDVAPLAGDDTDGHIDTLARFCNPETITYVQCTDDTDPHHESLHNMELQLQSMVATSGKPYRLVPLPWPNAQFDESGRRLPATYANFLILNGAVLVPTYGDANDSAALSVLAGCFPDREIVGIDCSALIRQNGSLHCITMQLPCGVLEPIP